MERISQITGPLSFENTFTLETLLSTVDVKIDYPDSSAVCVYSAISPCAQLYYTFRHGGSEHSNCRKAALAAPSNPHMLLHNRLESGLLAHYPGRPDTQCGFSIRLYWPFELRRMPHAIDGHSRDVRAENSTHTVLI